MLAYDAINTARYNEGACAVLPTPLRRAQPVALNCDQTGLSFLHIGATGPAVLLLHGWSAFKELWWSTLLALEPYARAFALDMPGHGGSALRDSICMAQIAERIYRFCVAQSLDRIMLVGHSMGGNVAVELALAHPRLVERLVLVDAAVQPLAMPAFTRAYLNRTIGWPALRTTMKLAQYIGMVGQFVPHAHSGGIVLPAVRRITYLARHDPSALHTLLEELFTNPLGPRLAELRLPTLVVSGKFDPLVPATLSQQVAADIPGACYAVVRRAAHNPMDERPREFARILLHFFEFPT